MSCDTSRLLDDLLQAKYIEDATISFNKIVLHTYIHTYFICHVGR